MLPRKSTTSPVAKRLKEARKSAGLSQRKLGLLAGLDPSVASARVNHYERQTHQPNVSLVRRFAAVLKKPLPYFFSDDDGLAELIALYGQLDNPARSRLLMRVRRLVQT